VCLISGLPAVVDRKAMRLVANDASKSQMANLIRTANFRKDDISPSIIREVEEETARASRSRPVELQHRAESKVRT